DLDNFKTVNDRDGHAAGDALLKEVAKRITDEIRTEDLAARIGGDEFAILLMNTGAEAAMEVASRLCSSLSKSFAASHVDVSASLGVVSWQPGIMDVKVIMELADQALYRAKEKGKKTIMQAKT
ncbi:MAG: GGDEF domain-containing protein, partial [Hylemonella sp.]